MPRNASGTYTLPEPAYVAGTAILSASMNSNLSDVATGLTQSLATTGVSSMTGPIKLADGSSGAPSLTLASDTTTGWFRSAAGQWSFVSTGTTKFTVGSTGISASDATFTNLTVTGSFSVAANRIVGEVVDYAGSSAPSLWLFAFGQAISRTTYSALFAVIGTTYGAGDGSTTFNVPDYRGRIGVGRDNMGGAAANRITVAGCGVNGTTLGATGGSETHVITVAQLASHAHALTDPTHNHGITDNQHSHTFNGPTSTFNATSGAALVFNTTTLTTTNLSATGVTVNFASTGITMSNTGSDSPHNNVQPIIIINKMIYVGV